MPLRIIYGEHDRMLPDVAQTMARVQKTCPRPWSRRCRYGHFLQEEAPGEVGALLAAFFAAEPVI